LTKNQMTKEETIEKIKAEIPFIDSKPYSHNIIGMLLGSIAEQFGNEEAEKLIKTLGLDRKGW